MTEPGTWTSLPGGGGRMTQPGAGSTPKPAYGQLGPEWGGKVRVLLVDDQPLFRDVARAMLERDGRFEVVGEASDGARAVEKVGECAPDVVLMDINMPVMTGLQATRRIKARHPDQNIILTSITGETDFSDMAEKAGALAFIEKRNLSSSILSGMLGSSPPPGFFPLSA